jgi:uncharacterized membrane protein
VSGERQLVERNVRALRELTARFDRRRTFSQRLADAVTSFLGSMWSVAIHGVIFGGWILANVRVIPGLKPFDPFPFVMLAMIASVEAIFLNTFVLISQNRMIVLQGRRAELDLEVDLLAEEQVARLARTADAIAAHLGIEHIEAPMREDVQPERILDALEDPKHGPS